MAKKSAAIVKQILDQNGCNYQIEKKMGKITFTLDNQYNDIFEDCPMYYILTAERHRLIAYTILKTRIKGDAQVPVSKLLSRINREIAATDMGTSVRVDLDIQEGVISIRDEISYLKCPEDYEISTFMSIPLCFMYEFGKLIIAVAYGELSVEEAYEDLQNREEGTTAFFNVI